MLLRLLKPQSCVAAVLLTVALLFCGCTGEPAYPLLLCQADSAYQQGRYHDGDSLLACYDSLAATAATLPAADGRPVSTAGEATGHYRLLLGLEQRFVGGMLTTDDFSSADSLVRYYDNSGTRVKHAQALLFLGDVYRLVADNPSALKCYLQAGEEAKREENPVLLEWTNQSVGDLYFEQGMYDECKDYYRRYYDMASSCRDTLRMAHAAHRMALLHTIESNVDSIVSYYRQAIALAECTSAKDNIIPYAKSNLCDIYIQTEQFDKALQLMKRDSVNEVNWAYWHLGQQHTDSAEYYFLRLMGKHGLRHQAEYLRVLAQLAEEKGELPKAAKYYARLVTVQDSLKVLSQEEEVRRVHAQYNYQSVRRERDELVLRQKRSLQRGVAMAFAVAILLAAGIIYVRRSNAQRQQLSMRLRILDRERQDMLRRSSFEKKEKSELTDRLQEVEQQLCAMAAERQRLSIEQLHNTPLYGRLVHRFDADGMPYKLSAEEWNQLEQATEQVFPHFVSRLLSLAKLTTDELHICILIKLGIPVSDIAILVHKSQGAISHSRKRMWEKMTGQEGTAGQMDDYIRKM